MFFCCCSSRNLNLSHDSASRFYKNNKISTGMSLISLSLGFSIFGMLIIVNRHQADLDGLCGGSSVATVGGIGAILVGTALLVATCLHWRFCANVLLRCRSGASLPAESVPLLKLQMYRF